MELLRAGLVPLEQKPCLDLRSSIDCLNKHRNGYSSLFLEDSNILRKRRRKFLTRAATDGEQSHVKDLSSNGTPRKSSDMNDYQVLPSQQLRNGSFTRVGRSVRSVSGINPNNESLNAGVNITENAKLDGKSSRGSSSEEYGPTYVVNSRTNNGNLEQTMTQSRGDHSFVNLRDSTANENLLPEKMSLGMDGPDIDDAGFRMDANSSNCKRQNKIISNTKSAQSTSEKSTDNFSSQHLSQNGSVSSLPDDRKAALAHLLASKNIAEFITRFPPWADAQKESGMPQRQKRAFYSYEDWLRHRSSMRYVRHMLSSLSSRVIVSLVPPVFTFTSVALVVATYNTAVNVGILPSFFPLLHAASLPYELTAPALALLLVFRTDASYSRYVEARKTWTTVISVTKDFARQSAQLIRSPEDEILKSSLLSYIMSFPISLKCHLIHGSDVGKELKSLLQEEDLAFVLASQHRPNCILQLMSRTLSLAQLEKTEKALLEAHISQHNTSISVCERLLRTPIPLSYTRLTSRFLVLWHTSLPVVLWDSCNWLIVPATFFSAATLFCIEEVGVVIEEPFPMLALDKIVGIALENIREMMVLQQKADDFLSRKVFGGGSLTYNRQRDPDGGL